MKCLNNLLFDGNKDEGEEGILDVDVDIIVGFGDSFKLEVLYDLLYIFLYMYVYK